MMENFDIFKKKKKTKQIGKYHIKLDAKIKLYFSIILIHN